MPRPNRAMREEARRGLDWRAEYGRGGTEVGVARARDIVNNRNLSIDTVKRIASFEPRQPRHFFKHIKCLGIFK